MVKRARMATEKKYSFLIGFKKAVVAAGAIAAALSAGMSILAPLAGPGKVTAIVVISAIVAAVRAGANYLKVSGDLADKTYDR